MLVPGALVAAAAAAAAARTPSASRAGRLRPAAAALPTAPARAPWGRPSRRRLGDRRLRKAPRPSPESPAADTSCPAGQRVAWRLCRGPAPLAARRTPRGAQGCGRRRQVARGRAEAGFAGGGGGEAAGRRRGWLGVPAWASRRRPPLWPPSKLMVVPPPPSRQPGKRAGLGLRLNGVAEEGGKEEGAGGGR